MIFADECRFTLDGPDGWARDLISSNDSAPVQGLRQQGGGRVMFGAAIVGDNIIGPFRVDDRVKIDSEGYCAFLNKRFRPWWKNQSMKLRKTLMYMHDNAPSHVSTYTTDWLMKHGIIRMTS